MGRRHLEAYLKNEAVTVTACCDANAEALKFLDTQSVNCRKYAGWKEMLKEERFDLLSIVTNAPTHAEIAIEAAKAKVPRIICEKPMATSIADGIRMIETARTNKTRLAINYSRRWSNDYSKLKELIKGEMIGRLCEVYCVCGGGLLACNGSHFFDLMRFLSNSEADLAIGFIDRTGTPNPRGAQFTDPGAYGLVRFTNGMRGFVDMYEDLGVPPRIEIVGSIGRVIIDETENMWVSQSRNGTDRLEPLGKYDLHLAEKRIESEHLDLVQLLKQTINEMLSERSISSTGEDGLASLHMVIGFHVSDKEGNIPIPLPLASKYRNVAVNFT
jgi:predicted dehydrogenase